MINPPMIVLTDGISLIQKIGNQTQKIPPITSVKDNKVSSAAGKFLDPIEIKQTRDRTVEASPIGSASPRSEGKIKPINPGFLLISHNHNIIYLGLDIV